MSYPWTRVPQEAPPFDALQLRLLPLADFFMALMLSRPRGLSLRTAWVTPATLGLAAASVAMLVAVGAIAIVAGISYRHVPTVVAGIVALMLALGAGSVAIYGIRQRLLR